MCHFEPSTFDLFQFLYSKLLKPFSRYILLFISALKSVNVRKAVKMSRRTDGENWKNTFCILFCSTLLAPSGRRLRKTCQTSQSDFRKRVTSFFHKICSVFLKIGGLLKFNNKRIFMGLYKSTKIKYFAINNFKSTL